MHKKPDFVFIYSTTSSFWSGFTARRTNLPTLTVFNLQKEFPKPLVSFARVKMIGLWNPGELNHAVSPTCTGSFSSTLETSEAVRRWPTTWRVIGSSKPRRLANQWRGRARMGCDWSAVWEKRTTAVADPSETRSLREIWTRENLKSNQF